MSVGTPIAWAISVETEPIIWFMASEAAESSISVRSPVSIGSGRPIMAAASWRTWSGRSTKRFLPVMPSVNATSTATHGNSSRPSSSACSSSTPTASNEPGCAEEGAEHGGTRVGGDGRRALDGLALVHGSSSSGASAPSASSSVTCSGRAMRSCTCTARCRRCEPGKTR